MGVRLGGYGGGALTDGADAGGTGRGRSLVSGAFRLLGAGGTVCVSGSSPSRARTRRLMAMLLTRTPGSDLNEEGSEVGWDGNGIKAEPEGGVFAS